MMFWLLCNSNLRVRGVSIIKRQKKVLSERDLIKIEIAKEMGIWDQVESSGWGSLSNATCGRIGGLVSSRLKNRDS